MNRITRDAGKLGVTLFFAGGAIGALVVAASALGVGLFGGDNTDFAQSDSLTITAEQADSTADALRERVDSLSALADSLTQVAESIPPADTVRVTQTERVTDSVIVALVDDSATAQAIEAAVQQEREAWTARVAEADSAAMLWKASSEANRSALLATRGELAAMSQARDQWRITAEVNRTLAESLEKSRNRWRFAAKATGGVAIGAAVVCLIRCG